MWRGEGDEEKRAKELLRIPSGSLIMDPVVGKVGLLVRIRVVH